ncbi:hypothetical protein B0T14DRAFT_565935 [Immersiella caudata]|uniref:Uncharacterized protein n=1 Tax=Immersiella caudata TaxID=314043 RepID=A0AA39WP70_9PEZI|nr:hypothetical protein B0T14DRAFT_565935 [Immersiella caudata]
MSSPSPFLARLLGPTAILLATTEFKNTEIFPSRDPVTIYLNGSILLVSGLSIVLRHNRWHPSWPVLITLLGWCALGLGFSRMMWPTTWLSLDSAGGSVYATEASLFLAGAVLCWKGYGGGRG